MKILLELQKYIPQIRVKIFKKQIWKFENSIEKIL